MEKIENKILELKNKYSNNYELGEKFRNYIFELVKNDQSFKCWLRYCNDNPNDFKLCERLRLLY